MAQGGVVDEVLLARNVAYAISLLVFLLGGLALGG